MRGSLLIGLAVLLVMGPPALAAQVRVEVPAASGRINVKFTESSDEGQADRLMELATRLKPISDQLDNLSDIDMSGCWRDARRRRPPPSWSPAKPTCCWRALTPPAPMSASGPSAI
jgi:hypothetical protein